MSAKDDLATKLVALEKRAADLEAQLAKIATPPVPPAPFKSEPHQPVDYTRGASMDRETMRDLAAAIPDTLARDLHADLARGNPINQSVAQLTPDRSGVEIRRGSGWAPERKIEPPPGIDLMDKIMDQADAQDRADLQRRLARSVKKE
jgi:hypothetical protein